MKSKGLHSSHFPIKGPLAFLMLGLVLSAPSAWSQLTCVQSMTPHGLHSSGTAGEIQALTELLRKIEHSHQKPEEFRQDLNEIFRAIGYAQPGRERTHLIQELASLDPDFFKLLTKRIIQEHMLPLMTQKGSGLIPSDLPLFINEKAQSLYTNRKQDSNETIKAMVEILGFLRRGRPMPTETAPNKLSLALNLPQKLSQWGYPFHHSDKTLEEKGNWLILHTFTNLQPELRAELLAQFEKMDNRSVNYFLNELFELPETVPTKDLNTIRKYPSVFVESLLWDPFYNPLAQRKKHQQQIKAARANDRAKLIEDSQQTDDVREAIIYFLTGRSSVAFKELSPAMRAEVEVILDLWKNRMSELSGDVIQMIVGNMKEWPNFYKQILINHFFNFGNDGAVSLHPLNVDKLQSLLATPSELLLLEKPEVLEQMTHRELTELHMGILKLDPALVEEYARTVGLTHPLLKSLNFLSEVESDNRALDVLLRERANSANKLERVYAKIGLLKRGFQPNSFTDLLETYREDPIWLVTQLIRANAKFPLDLRSTDDVDYQELLKRIRSSARFGGVVDEVLAASIGEENSLNIPSAWARYFIRDLGLEGPQIDAALSPESH